MHDDNDLTDIGTYQHNNGIETETRPFGIRRDDRRRHLYAIGKTGTGKSTLLEQLLRQDIFYGEGVALLDPHGDLAERLLECIPPARTDELCYFDPSDLAFPIGFNIVADQPADKRHLAVSGVVSAFHAYWADSWGDRLETILRNGLDALTELPGTTILQLPRLLNDDAYRERVTARLIDPELRRYWRDEFGRYTARQRAEYTAPVLNRVGRFLMSPMMRNMFGQERSAFNPRTIMDRHGIFIANLSKADIGEDKANLIGSLLVSSFALAALSRSDVPEPERTDFYLYADEFQNFATDSFATILSEARKFRLSLSLFHQYEDQLSDTVRAAIFGNVGTMLAFAVGQRDAEHLAGEFRHELTPEDFTGLRRFQIAVSMLEHGEWRKAFLAHTTRPAEPQFRHRRDVLLARSRRRYARARDDVERELAIQYEAAAAQPPNKKAEPPKPKPIKTDPNAIAAWREKLDELERKIKADLQRKGEE